MTAPLLRATASWLLVALTASGLATAGELDLSYVAIDLPGAPAQVLPVELDGDSGPELAVVVAYTAWDEIATEEVSEIDAVEGLVAVMTIVPALLESRELWIFDRQEDGSWRPVGDPMELDSDIVSLEATGRLETPLVALTDSGIDRIRLHSDGSGLEREQLLSGTSALSGSGAFLPHLEWTHDLDGDSWPDLLLPTTAGWNLHSGREDGFSEAATQQIQLPPFDDLRTPWRRDLPLLRVRDIDGDQRPDLLAPHPTRGWNDFFLYRNEGGRFSAPIGPLGYAERDKQLEKERPRPKDDEAEGDEPEPQYVVFFDDLDGDGRAEYVSQQEVPPREAGMKEMAHAKRPPFRYRVFDASPSTAPEPSSRLEFVADGYSFPGPAEVQLPGGLWDLDGDGRRDLVTLNLDFSVLQAVRILVTQSISIGIDFQVHCQQSDGSFRLTPGLDLSGRFRLNLRNFRQGQLSLFNGDFDGDGRRDFVQIGRGRTVSIHRGAAGCDFPQKPDLEIELVEAPKDLALVEVSDLDGDGLSDLAITQPRGRKRGAESSPVRLDLYLSGGSR